MGRRRRDEADAAGAPDTPEEAVELAEEIEAGRDAGAGAEGADLEQQLADMESKWLRAVADYQNYQRRAAENQLRARQEGRTGMVQSLLPALDNLDIALAQDADSVSVESLQSAMRSVADQLLRAFAQNGVEAIRPEVGEAFDHDVHQAVAQQPSADHAPGSVLSVLQAGYRLDTMVLRPATVVVATAPAEDAGDDA